MVLQARFDTKEEITPRASCLHPETYELGKRDYQGVQPFSREQVETFEDIP